MAVITEYIRFSSKGNAHVIDLTPEISDKLGKLDIKDGIVTVSAIGSTASITTCEYEPGLVQDIPEIFDKLIPEVSYNHDKTWGDGNGHSHLRASLVGPSITVPFKDKELILGTWQQVIFIDFDNRNRNRKVVLQFIGE
ncbi:MAG: secondary thiamine-phosphate synthase enzyme [Omnitrophica WOR_2 bacterium GWF2_38_59]|nr:MAG: secondary thiamine-phosphate synthase enzyme [Omnitrophica WOR_2 bacterium GWF2_38_59]OGX50514.1 MAG: secondary thiamine-phosphate synthase enzyme [Omnitrophica WOR_2 bacterium RIFOXYA2_FULL_38_17]OGX54505.1 MAG: secondary thiamine-phosphate synthase enzyme [Omnitrophica WOR_2 bacterium RIFOXYA12_FULL_38_10]OGX55416.1 MAG: secondary thiamine-phosphate synthase enzyme [Omnitrophica WOR_2 bacterium RIFOXYC2_FULL_38_12]OGX59523.1 MAG: secondary thiamine-phosphate synthase enzyme [Omnitroph